MARFYTFLFAILPRRYQNKLWDRLANKYGYHGLTKFGNGTMRMQGTRLTDDDFYKKYTADMHTEDWPDK